MRRPRKLQLPVSSWGRGGYAEVWLQPRSQWVTSAAARGGGSHGAGCAKAPETRAAQQPAAACTEPSRARAYARAKQRLDVHPGCGNGNPYAAKRIETHISHFHKLLNGLETAASDKELVRHSCIPLERRSPFLPELHYRLFQTSSSIKSVHHAITCKATFE